MIKGTVFNIQRYTVHDGPGIRTELFLKGCPLSCLWCSNPESHRGKIQPGVYSSKCIGQDKCGSCTQVCGHNALMFENNKLVSIDRNSCMNCIECAKVCPSDAIKIWGEEMTVEQAMEIIRKDKAYYEKSGGGVTFSGGEPLVQSEFVLEILKRCKSENIHTCVESTLCVNYGIIEKILPYTDLFITDIKMMNSKLHQKYTGMGNEIILENIRRLACSGKPLIIRIPLIPGINEDMKNITETADFILKELNNKILYLQLLEFMRLGEEKYKSLGISYPMKNLKFNKEEFLLKVKETADYFNIRNINCITGTTTKEHNKI